MLLLKCFNKHRILFKILKNLIKKYRNSFSSKDNKKNNNIRKYRYLKLRLNSCYKKIMIIKKN